MSKFLKGQSSKKSQVWLQRLVKFWLASGMIAMPWAGSASEITRTDGGPAIIPTGAAGSQVHNIYAGKDMGNGVGASTFSKFNVTQGDVANMHFRTSAASTTHFNTLLNFVDSRIDVNGTVNAIRNGNIGGNLYFLSPAGMAVGANGAINAGSLTVLTPTSDWWKDRSKAGQTGVFDISKINGDDIGNIQNMYVPINATGTIAIQGKINVTDDLRLQAGKINIGADVSGANKNAAFLTSGVNDFSNIVNVDQLAGTGITDVNTLKATASGGDIIIAAEVSFNANTDMDQKAVNAEVNIVGGSQIKARLKADVTATALNNSTVTTYQKETGGQKASYYCVNGTEMTEEEFKTKFGDGSTSNSFYSNVHTKAVINILDDGAVDDAHTRIEGREVNVVALSQNTYTSDLTSKGLEGYIVEGLSSIFLNGMDVCVGQAVNKAEVTVGEGTVLYATGTGSVDDNCALNVQALATTNITIGTWAGFASLASIFSSNANLVPSLMVNYGSSENIANVTIGGRLEAVTGGINVDAIANNTICSSAASGILGLGILGNSDATLSFGIGGVEGLNSSSLIVKKTAELQAHGNIELQSYATSNITNAVGVVSTEKSAAVFGIGWLDYDNSATLTMNGKVISNTGSITLDAEAVYPIDKFNISASAGQGFIARFFGETIGIKHAGQDIMSKFSSWLGKQGGSKKTFADTMADYLKLGISFGYMDETNTSNLTIGSGAVIKAKHETNGVMDKDVIIKSYASIDDLFTYVVGASYNKEEYQIEGHESKNLVNGALFLRTVTNNSNLIFDVDNSGDGNAVVSGGNITLDSQALMPYNRFNNLVMKVWGDLAGTEVDPWSQVSEEDAAVLKKYYDAAEKKKKEIDSELYDENGNLKPEYADEQTNSDAVLEKMNEFQESQEYKDYVKLLTTGDYVDENGNQQHIDFNTSSFSITALLMDVISAVNPQNYFSYSVASETGNRSPEKDPSTSEFGIGIAFGYSTVENNARILVGQNTQITGGDNVLINGKAYYSDIIVNGGYTWDSTGSKGGNIDLVTVSFLDNNSLVAVAEGVNITSGADLSAKVDTGLSRVAVSKPILMNPGSAGTLVILEGSYYGTNNNSILSIDDEVSLSGKGCITLTGNNALKAIYFDGAIATGGKNAGAVAFSYVDLMRNNLVAVADNDGVGVLLQTNKDAGDTKATDLSEMDDEQTRLKKILATESGLSVDKGISFYSSHLTKTGDITTADWQSKASTSGKLGQFTIGLAISSDSDKENEKKSHNRSLYTTIKDRIKNGKKSKRTDNFQQVLDQEMGKLDNVGLNNNEVNNNAGQREMDADGNEQGAAQQNNGPKLSVSGAGAVGVLETDVVTAAMMKGTTLNITQATGGVKNTVNDDSLLIAVAGGVASAKTGSAQGSSGGDKSIALSGAATAICGYSQLSAIVADTNINGAKEIYNTAARNGVLADVAAAVSVSSGNSNKLDLSLALGAAVNLMDYETKALLSGNSVNTLTGADAFPAGFVATDIINMALDQDLQILGGIDIAVAKGGKTAVGIGAIVNVGIVNNDVIALVDNGSLAGNSIYKKIGDVDVVAATDLTQINAAVGVGVATSTGEKSTGVVFQGDVIYTELKNNVQANVKGITLDAETLDVMAYDTDLSDAISNANKATLQVYGFDVNGQVYIDSAQAETTEDGGSKTNLQDNGNLIISGVLEISAATGSGASIGAGVVVGIIDNDFKSIVENSTVTLSGGVTVSGDSYIYPAQIMAESNTLQVGVAAGGNGSESGFAGGGSVVINLFENDVIAKAEGSSFNAAGLRIDAKNKQKLVNVAGSVNVGKNAVGLDMVYNYMLNNTYAYFKNSSIENSTSEEGEKTYSESNLVLDATNKSDVYAIAVGVTASMSASGAYVAANGSVAVNRGQNNVEAVAENTTGEKKDLVNLKTFTVHSKDDSYMVAATGGLTLTTGKTAFGGSLTWNRLGSLTVSNTGTIGTDDTKKQVNKALVSEYDIHMAKDGVLTVKAEDEADFTTVAIGLGVGTANTKFTLQGANANAYISKETTASIIGGNINQNNDDYDDATHFADVNVTADTDNNFTTISVVMASADKVALGAALSQNTMKADTRATVAAAAANSGYLTKDMLVKATSEMDLMNTVVGVSASGLVSIGGSVVVNEMNNNTLATFGGTAGGVTTVNSQGSVGVISASKENFENYSGQATVSVSKEVAVGAGAAVAVNKVGSNTQSVAQNADVTTKASTGKTITLYNSIAGAEEIYQGFIVDADAYHKFYNAPFCGGLTVSKVVSLAADATVAVDEMGGTTKANVYSVTLNKDKKESIESGNDFVVQATDKTDAEPVITNAVASIAASGAISVSANVGAGVGTFKNERTVESVVTGDKSNNRYILNADKVKVNADNELDFKATDTAVSVVVSAGTGSASGTCATGVLYVDLDSITKAAMTGVESTNNVISLTSNQDTDFDIVGTSVAVAVSASLYGASLSVGTHVDTVENDSKTITLLENSNIYHYEDNIAKDVISAKSNYKSHNQDCNVSASASIASGAVGILVVDNELNNVVTTDVKDSTIGTKNKQAKNIDVISVNNVSTDFDNQNIAAAIGLSVGVGVGLSTVDTSVASNVTSSTLYARDNIDINAEQNVTMLGEMVAVPVGLLSVGVSTLHNYVGVAVVDDQYENWEDETITKEEMQTNDFSSKNIDDLVVECTGQGDTVLNGVETTYTGFGKGTVEIASAKKVARSAVIDSKGAKVNLTNANLIAGNDIKATVKQNVNADPEITAVGVGAVAVNVETNRIRVKNDVGINVIGGYFGAGHDINLSAATAGTLKADTIQVGVGALAVGVAVGEITKDGNMGITLNTADMVADNAINVSTMDNMGIRHTGTGSNDGGLCVTAVDYKAKDNLVNTITLQYDADMDRGNNLEANNISIHSYSVPDVYSEFLAVSIALAEGCGVVMESDINNQAYLTLEDGNRLWADTVTLDSGVYADSGKNNLYTDVLGVGVTGVAVHVNKSRTYTNVVAGTTVGSLTLKTEEYEDGYGNTVKIGKSTVAINAFDGTSTYNHLQGVTVGLAVASGSNYSQSRIKSNVYTTVDAGNSGIYAKDLTISANGKDTLKSKADGDGGGVVGISPEAAVVETEVDGKTKTTIMGYYNVTGAMSVNAVRTDDLSLNANATNAQLVGGSGTKTDIKHINEDTSVNVSDATIDAYGKLNIASDNIIYVNKDNSYAVDGNGYGGADATVSSLKSTIRVSSVANIDSAKINAHDAINISANTTDYVVLANSVFSAGIISSKPCATTDTNTTITDRVVISDSKNTGTEIRATAGDKDLIIAASDHTDLYVRAYTEAECGFAGAVAPDASSNLTRNSSIELNNGALYGARDVKLYSGKEVSNSLGYMNLRVESEAFNGNVTGVIPISVALSNNVNQNNTITIGGAGDVRSIRHTELYADAGRESITKVAEYHTWCYTDNQGSSYVSTSDGSINGAVSRNNYVEVNGNVSAGLANSLTINIGTSAGEFVIVGDQEREMVTEAYTGTSQKIYSGSDEDKAKFINFGDANSQAVADGIGLTIDDFIVGRQSYSTAVGNRLNEINALLAEYGEDSDPTVKAGLEAEQARLQEIMATMGAGSSGSDTVTPDMIDYILVPDLAGSGGNITVNTQNFRGSGKVEAKGNPEITINNYTNLMLVTQKITMDDPGGVIYYNNQALDFSAAQTKTPQQQVRDINISNAAVNLDLIAAEHADDPTVNINGMFSGTTINFKGGTYYLTDEYDNYVTYDPNDAAVGVSYKGRLGNAPISHDNVGEEVNDGDEYNYFIDGVTSSDTSKVTGGKYYFTKDCSKALLTDTAVTIKDSSGTALTSEYKSDIGKYLYSVETSDGKYYICKTDTTPRSSRVVYQSGRLKGSDGNYFSYKKDDNNKYYENLEDGKYKPKADIQIAGNINSLKGSVKVTSNNNSIIIGGESVTEDVSITAKLVELIAPNGSITQTYTDGTVSVGGDVRSQYDKLYSDFVNAEDVKDIVETKEKKTSLIIAEVADGTKASSDVTGSWIAGGQVYIAANDININGTVQSGYDKYTAEITTADQQVIDNIVANWTNSGKQQITDSTVKNSGTAYLVKEGGAYWNATRKCYEYRMNVYYNPSTQQLLTADVNANGGRITLTGRIASTGNGNVICLDGAYNITVNNKLNYDLRLGELAVNDTKGLISITDPSYYVTLGGKKTNVTAEITTAGTKYKYYDPDKPGKDKYYYSDTNPEKFTSMTQITGSGRSYIYQPDKSLRYEWVTGYTDTQYTRYYTEEMAKWWGAADYKQKSQAELDSWIDGGQAVEVESSTEKGDPRTDGAYLSTATSNVGDVYFKHTGQTVSSKTSQEGSVQEWSTGVFGCHKWRKYTYVRETGNTFSDFASVKASAPINITMIGVAAEDSVVDVNTTKNLYFGQMIGNSELYTVGTDHIEKGTVNLISNNGSVIQEGSNIYGATVNLSAKNDLQNISIVAGDTVNLSGVLNGTGKANVVVEKAYGGGSGNVILRNFGGSNAAVAELTAGGSITQDTISNIVQAKRINLTSGGSVSGRNGTALYLIGGQDVDADSQDTMRASVSIDAYGDVNINQKSGDLRIGTIYSKTGSVNITVPNGSIHDALPYVESDNADTEAELIAKWQSMGLIDGDDDSSTRSEGQVSKDAALVAGKRAKTDYEENVEGEFQDYKQLIKGKEYDDLDAKKKAHEKDPSNPDLTVEEQGKYDSYNNDIARYTELDRKKKSRVQLTEEELKQYYDISYKIDHKQTITAAEQQTYNNLSMKMNTYQTLTEAEEAEFKQLDKYVNYLTNFSTVAANKYTQYNVKYADYAADETAANYLANDQAAKALMAQLQANVDHISNTTYEGWNKYQLLYALQDAVINQHAGVESSDKKPNIYANNVNLIVKNDVGLNSPNVTTIDLNGTITLDDLKKLSKADAATVTWKIDEQGHKIVTIQDKLAIGLHQTDGSGKINVTTTDPNVNNTKNVFLEVRKNDSEDNGYLSMVIGSINAANGNGDVRISSLKDILTSDANSVLSARDVVLLTGETGTDNGNIGSEANYFDLNMTGMLTATATGNIYLKQVAVDGVAKDWNIGSMTAGVVGASASTTSGNIYLVADGNIYNIYDANTDAQTYVRTDSKGLISIVAGGSIGNWNDRNKTFRVMNDAGSVELKAANEIVVEGVSSSGGTVPAGTLNVTSAVTDSKKLKLTVNGTLALGDVKYANDSNIPIDGSEIVLGASEFDFNNTYIADKVSVTGSLGIAQHTGEIKGNTVTLTAGEKLDLTSAVMGVSESDLQKSTIVQYYDNSGDATSLKVTAKTLNVNSYGTVDMGTKNNQFGNVHLDAGADIILGGGKLKDDIFGGSTEAYLDITNTHPGNQRSITALDKNGQERTFTLTNVTNGDLAVRIYDTDTTVGDTNLTVLKDVLVDGDVAFVNQAGKLTLAGQNNKVVADGVFIAVGAGFEETNVVIEKSLYSKGIAIVGKNNVELNSSQLASAKYGLYIESINGNVTDSSSQLGALGLVKGNVTIKAENGSIVNGRAYLAEKNITLKAKSSITNDATVTQTQEITDALNAYGLTWKDIGMRSLDGNITIYTIGNADSGEGVLTNTTGLKADNGNILLYANKAVQNDSIIDAQVNTSAGATQKAVAGVVTILSNGTVTNGDGVGNDNYIYGQNGVYLLGGTSIDNKEKLYADTGNIVIGGASEYKGEGAGLVVRKDTVGSVTNSGSMYVATDGNVRILSGSTVTNTGDMHTENGDVTIVSDGNISNTNTMYAMNGEVRLQSLNGNIDNKDDFRKGTGTEAVASSTVTMLAENGYINNQQAVYAGKGITIRSKLDIGNASIGSNIKDLYTTEGDVTLTSLNGSVFNGEVDGSGNVTTFGMKIHSGKGNIIITAATDIVNTGSVSTDDGDIIFQSADGNITNTDTLISENAGASANGAITMLAESTNDDKGYIKNYTALHAKKDITLRADKDLLIYTGKSIVSDEGDILIYANNGNVTNNASIEAKDGNITMFGVNITNAVGNGGIKAAQDLALSSANDDVGRVILVAKKELTNAVSGTSTTDEFIYGQNGVYMVVGKALNNAADIKAEAGDIALVRPEEYQGETIPVVDGGTSVTNTGNITVSSIKDIRVVAIRGMSDEALNTLIATENITTETLISGLTYDALSTLITEKGINKTIDQIRAMSHDELSTLISTYAIDDKAELMRGQTDKALETLIATTNTSELIKGMTDEALSEFISDKHVGRATAAQLKAMTDEDLTALIAEKNINKTAAQLKAMTDEDLTVLIAENGINKTVTELRNMDNDAIETLIADKSIKKSPAEVRNMDEAELNTWIADNDILKTPNEIRAMSDAELDSLINNNPIYKTTAELRTSSDAEINTWVSDNSILKTKSELKAMNDADLNTLIEDKVINKTPAELKAMTDEQLSTLCYEKVINKTPAELKAMSEKNLKALIDDKVINKTSVELKGMTDADLTALIAEKGIKKTVTELRAMDDASLTDLIIKNNILKTTTELKAMNDGDLTALIAAKVINKEPNDIKNMSDSDCASLIATKKVNKSVTEIRAMSDAELDTLISSNGINKTSAEVRVLEESVLGGLLNSYQVKKSADDLRATSDKDLNTWITGNIIEKSATDLIALDDIGLQELIDTKTTSATALNKTVLELRSMSDAALQVLIEDKDILKTSAEVKKMTMADLTIMINDENINRSATEVKGMSNVAIGLIIKGSEIYNTPETVRGMTDDVLKVVMNLDASGVGNVDVGKGNVILHAVGKLNDDGTLSVPTTNGAVTNSGSVTTANGNITITADGNITNSNILTTYGAGEAGGDVIISSGYGDIAHSNAEYSRIIAVEGNVGITALNGKATVDSNILAEENIDVVAKKDVVIGTSAGVDLYNEDDKTEKRVIHSNSGNIIFAAGENLTNKANIWAEDGNVLLLTKTGALANNSHVRATKGGSVYMKSGSTIDNNKGIFALGGGVVVMVADNNIVNSGNIFSFSQTIDANKSYTYSEKRTGSIGLISKTGNVTNTNSGEFTIPTLTDDEATKTKTVLVENYEIDLDDVKLDGQFVSCGGVVLSAVEGSVNNSKPILACDDILIRAKEEIVNSDTGSIRGIRSLNGDIYLISLGRGTGVGSITNSKKLETDNGSIFMTATGNIVNNSDMTAKIFVHKDDEAIVLTYVQSDANGGHVALTAGGTITNTENIYADSGISLLAKGDITNGDSSTTDSIAKTKSGNIVISSVKGEVTNYAKLSADGVVDGSKVLSTGNVLITAKGNVTNSGSIFAKTGKDQTGLFTGDMDRDGGWIGIFSKTGNITNSDRFGTGDHADGSIWMEALEGSITNSTSLFANNNITIKSKVAITMTGTEEGAKSIKSLVKGDVTLCAFGTGASGTIYNEDTISTASGNIYITANGSKEETLTIKTYNASGVKEDTTETFKISVQNKNFTNDGGSYKPGGNIIAKGGDVIIVGERAVVNQGDILAKSSAAVDDNDGNLIITSNHGGLVLYETEDSSDPDHIESPKNIFAAQNSVLLNAPYGILYNEKDLVSGGDVVMVYGGGGTGKSITVDNKIMSTNGNVDLRTNDAGTKLIIASKVTAMEGKVDIFSAGSLVIAANQSGESYAVKSKESAILNAVDEATIIGDVISENNSVNVGAKQTATVDGKITAENGVATVGTETGNIIVTGTMVGDKVVLYTEGEDANISFKDIVVTDELILAGNHWNESNDGVLDMTKVLSDSDSYVLKLYGAGRTIGGGNYKLDYGNNSQSVLVGDACVETLEIRSEAPVLLDHINVSDRADIYSQGTKSSVYGQPHSYDDVAKTIYYDPGSASVGSIDLHDMYFDGDTTQYQGEMDKLMQDSNQFSDGNGTMNNPASGNGGMSLYMYEPTLQRGTGILMKNYYGQTTFAQRFSAETLEQHLNSEKAQDFYNGYFNMGVEFFESYNLLDIPSADLNQGHGQRTSNVIQLETMFEEGGVVVEGTTTDKNGKKIKKTVEYEF